MPPIESVASILAADQRSTGEAQTQADVSGRAGIESVEG